MGVGKPAFHDFQFAVLGNADLILNRTGHPFHHFVIDHIMLAVLEVIRRRRNNFDRLILIFFRYSGHIVM